MNALSEWLELEIRRDGKVWRQTYRARRARRAARGDRHHRASTGTRVTFLPDPQIFATTEFSFDVLVAAPARAVVPERRARASSITRRAQRQEPRLPLRGRHRLLRRAPEPHASAAAPAADPHRGRAQFDAERQEVPVGIEIALQYNDGVQRERLLASPTTSTRSRAARHLIGFRTALTRTLNRYVAQQAKNGKDRRSRRSPGDDIARGPDRGDLGQAPAAASSRGRPRPSSAPARCGPRRGARLRAARRPTSRRTRRSPSRSSRRCSTPRARAQAARKARDLVRRKGALVGPQPAGQARRLPGERPCEVRALHRRGRLGRRHRQAGPRPRDPGDPADPRQDPERRARAPRQDALERRRSRR